MRVNSQKVSLGLVDGVGHEKHCSLRSAGNEIIIMLCGGLNDFLDGEQAAVKKFASLIQYPFVHNIY